MVKSEHAQPTRIRPDHLYPVRLHQRDQSRHRLFSVLSTLSLALIDIAALAGSFWLAWNLHAITGRLGPELQPPLDSYLIYGSAAISITIVVFAMSGLYRRRRGVSRLDEMYKIVTLVSLGLILALAATSFILADDFIYSRQMLLYAWIFSILGISCGRFLQRGVINSLRSRGIAADRLLIVGAGSTGSVVVDKVKRSPHLGYNLVGLVRHRPWPPGQVPEHMNGIPILGTTDALAQIVEKNEIDEIIVAMSGGSHEEVLEVIFQVSDQPVSVKVYPDTFRLLTSDVLSISDLDGLPTVSVRTVGLRPLERAIKRIMDLIVSAVVLIVLSPLFFVLAAAIKIGSPGPVFFVQERVGLDGRRFQLIKFRSMPVDAENESGPVFATKDDSRPTRLGRFMRRYSIDELPQFINVLFGEMSVVGPRPERPYFVEQFRQTVPAYMIRHYEKSGITGWAQVNAQRGNTSIDERTRYDLYYVENWSILFDFKIIIKTAIHIFKRDNNAY